MRRIAVVLIGIGLVILGGLWIFKDIYGENIAGAAEDMAVNMVAIKINESLKTGFYNSTARFCRLNATKTAILST